MAPRRYAAPRGHENGAGDTLPAAMKGNKPPTPEPPIPTLAEFIETCRAAFRFLVDDFGFQEARYSDPYQQFLVRFTKDDRWLDVYGEGYGRSANCRVGCGNRGPLYLVYLKDASLPKPSPKEKPGRGPETGQLAGIRREAQFAREHAKDFLSGDTSRFALIWDAKHAPRPPQNTGPSRLPP